MAPSSSIVVRWPMPAAAVPMLRSEQRADAVGIRRLSRRAADRVLRHVLRQRRVGLALRWPYWIRRTPSGRRRCPAFSDWPGARRCSMRRTLRRGSCRCRPLLGRMVRCAAGVAPPMGDTPASPPIASGYAFFVDVEHLVDVREPGSFCGSKKKTVLPITFTLAAASVDSFACTSRGHASGRCWRWICSSIAMIATLSLGVFDVIFTPGQSSARGPDEPDSLANPKRATRSPGRETSRPSRRLSS